MVFHILNGDALAYSFHEAKLVGEVVVFREALIDGDLAADNMQAFWEARSRYIQIEYDEYYKSVVREIERIINAPSDTEFNLWFEYDLFCQVNMWFLISVIRGLEIKKKVFAVYTSFLPESSQQFWNGFGKATTNELLQCFSNRICLKDDALQMGTNLWKAYKNGQQEELISLANHSNPAFPYLKKIVQAQVERFPGNSEQGRPERVLREIINRGMTSFHDVFIEFWKRESIYGFGDHQLKKLYDKIVADHN